MQPVPRMVPALQTILDAELARGNSVLSVGDWPPDCRLFVQLARPFRKRYPAPPGITYATLNDPHYWKAEYARPMAPSAWPADSRASARKA